MGIKIERNESDYYVVGNNGYILVTPPIGKLIEQGFKLAWGECLHWLVLGGRWRCFYNDHDRRAPFPCRLPIGHDWDHASSWSHIDGRRVLYVEPYGLSGDSVSMLSKFAIRYSLELEFTPCFRRTAPAIGVRVESQGGRLKLPRLSIAQEAKMWSMHLWEWEMPPE